MLTVIYSVLVQTLPTEQATPALTDSFSQGHDPSAHACKARPLTFVGWPSLSVSMSMSKGLHSNHTREVATVVQEVLLSSTSRRYACAMARHPRSKWLDGLDSAESSMSNDTFAHSLRRRMDPLTLDHETHLVGRACAKGTRHCT